MAVADDVTTAEETPVGIDVMSDWLDSEGSDQGDYDPDGDSIGIKKVTKPDHGTAIVVASGDRRSESPYWFDSSGRDFVSYTPDPGFFGEDSFDYTIEDGKGGEATAKVTVKVVEDGAVTIAVTGDKRFRINDDFTEHLSDPNQPNVQLSDRNPDPATGKASINPSDSLLKSATITVAQNDNAGTLTWSVPANVTVWWQKDGNWVQVANDNNYQPTGAPINLLIEGINVGAGTLSATFTPQGGRGGSNNQILTVYSPLKIDGLQAQALVTQIGNAANYTLTRSAATNEVWVDRGSTQPTTWQTAFRTQFNPIWTNGDTTRRDGVTTIHTGADAVPFGSYDDEKLDADDFAAVAAKDAQFAAVYLIHELVEEYNKQIKGMVYLNVETDDFSGGAHTEGIRAEEAVAGQSRTSFVVTPTEDANEDLIFNFVIIYGAGPTQVKVEFKGKFPDTAISEVSVTR